MGVGVQIPPCAPTPGPRPGGPSRSGGGASSGGRADCPGREGPPGAALRQTRAMSSDSDQTPPRRGRTGRALRALSKVALGAALVGAGIGHLTTLREEFQAQVPDWVPFDPDDVVAWSGYAEIALGAATLLVWKQPHRARVGALGAAFFLAVFPGNIAQWVEQNDGFGLDTDEKRLARLAFQPVLMVWSVYAGDRPGRRRLESAD